MACGDSQLVRKNRRVNDKNNVSRRNHKKGVGGKERFISEGERRYVGLDSSLASPHHEKEKNWTRQGWV